MTKNEKLDSSNFLLNTIEKNGVYDLNNIVHYGEEFNNEKEITNNLLEYNLINYVNYNEEYINNDFIIITSEFLTNFDNMQDDYVNKIIKFKDIFKKYIIIPYYEETIKWNLLIIEDICFNISNKLKIYKSNNLIKTHFKYYINNYNKEINNKIQSNIVKNLEKLIYLKIKLNHNIIKENCLIKEELNYEVTKYKLNSHNSIIQSGLIICQNIKNAITDPKGIESYFSKFNKINDIEMQKSYPINNPIINRSKTNFKEKNLESLLNSINKRNTICANKSILTSINIIKHQILVNQSDNQIDSKSISKSDNKLYYNQTETKTPKSRIITKKLIRYDEFELSDVSDDEIYKDDFDLNYTIKEDKERCCNKNCLLF